MFGYEEAEVTIISYAMQAVGGGKNVVRVLCDDTDMFVLLVYWMWRNQLVDKCHMQMERWNGAVFNINQTCTKLGSKRIQLLGMHALTGSPVSSMSSGRKTPCNGTFWRLDCHTFVHLKARNQAHP